MAFSLGPVGRVLLLTAFAGALSAGCGARAGLLEDYQPVSGGSAGAGASGGVGGSTGGTTTSVTTTPTTTTTSSTTSTITTTTTTTDIPPPDQVISQSPDSVFEGETSVVATPDGTVAAAWIAVNKTGGPYIAYAFSSDDGKTWQPPIGIPSPDNRYGSDPVFAADAEGNIYLTWVAFHVKGMSNVTDMQVYVAKATPKTFKFLPPVLASEPDLPASSFLDKPWIAVTPKGSVVVSYARFDNNQLLLDSARSADGGQTFTRTPILKSDNLESFYNLCYLCVSQETGRLYATFLDVQQFGQQTVIKTELSFSDDDAQSWPAANHTVVSSGEQDVAFEDPSCTARGNDVYVTYGLSKDMLDQMSEDAQKLYSIKARQSIDGGKSFEKTMEVGDPTAAPFFMLPDLKHDENGLLEAVYYAGNENEDSNASFRRTFFAFGQDKPQSQPVHQPLIFAQSRAVPYWLGDYVGHYVGNGNIYMTYVVNEDQLSHVAFATFPVPPGGL
jgi:hypothetical protein